MTLCPKTGLSEGQSSFLYPVECTRCASCPGRRIWCVHPRLILSLVAKEGGGQGHRAVRGQETGEVEARLVRLGVGRSRQAAVSWVVASWAILSNCALGYPGYVTLTPFPSARPNSGSDA